MRNESSLVVKSRVSPVNETFTVCVRSSGLMRSGMWTLSHCGPVWSNGSAREKGRPLRTAATPRCTTSAVMRLRVPRWSSSPQRPRLETRAANFSSSGVSGMAARYLACVSLPGGRRMPAETDPHRCTLMAWPPDVPQCIYTPEQLEPARDAYAEIARAIARFEPVALAVAPSDLDGAKARVDGSVEL